MPNQTDKENAARAALKRMIADLVVLDSALGDGAQHARTQRNVADQADRLAAAEAELRELEQLAIESINAGSTLPMFAYLLVRYLGGPENIETAWCTSDRLTIAARSTSNRCINRWGIAALVRGLEINHQTVSFVSGEDRYEVRRAIRAIVAARSSSD